MSRIWPATCKILVRFLLKPCGSSPRLMTLSCFHEPCCNAMLFEGEGDRGEVVRTVICSQNGVTVVTGQCLAGRHF